MKTTVTFLMVSLAILLVSAYTTSGTVTDNDVPQGLVASLALLGTLGLTHRTRRLRHSRVF